MRSPVLAFFLLTAGCAQIDTGTGGGGPASSSAPSSDDDEGPDCGVEAGRILGVVSYNAPLESPDGWPADGVEVLLTAGGPVFRTLTGPGGSFDLAVDPGRWALQPDLETGCGDGVPLEVEVDRCETVEVELVIDLCSG